jgi:hypothetical protein
MQLKIPSTTFWPSKLRADHSHNINFFALLKFGKHETTNQTPFNHFHCYLSYGCTDVLRATYLARTGKSGARGPSRSLGRSTVILRLSRL